VETDKLILEFVWKDTGPRIVGMFLMKWKEPLHQVPRPMLVERETQIREVGEGTQKEGPSLHPKAQRGL
jgi:hypothetical protein